MFVFCAFLCFRLRIRVFNFCRRFCIVYAGGKCMCLCLSEILFLMLLFAILWLFLCEICVFICSFADMDDADDKSYHPRPEFVEDKREPLIDLELTDSTELWLIQWPTNQV